MAFRRRQARREGTEEYRRFYSERAFWRKLGAMPRTAGLVVVEKAVTLYVILTDRSTPLAVRLLVIAVLGYFICPLDGIPDALPLVGYLDDVTAMAIVLARLSHLVTPDVKRRVERLLPEGIKPKTKERRTESNEQVEHEESGIGNEAGDGRQP